MYGLKVGNDLSDQTENVICVPVIMYYSSHLLSMYDTLFKASLCFSFHFP